MGLFCKLLDASAAMDPEAAAQEYTDLFVGVGKCEVNLHGSHWIAGFMIEKPLVESCIRTPVIEPNPNLALAVIQAAGDKVAGVGIDFYLVAIFGSWGDGSNRAGENELPAGALEGIEPESSDGRCGAERETSECDV